MSLLDGNVVTGWEKTKDIAETFSYILTAIAAIIAAIVYRRNSRLERARWASNLYEKFYEGDRYKKIRDLLDVNCKPTEGCQACGLANESHPLNMEFSDYLNFFELISFLEKSKQVKSQDVEDLFCYYLNCLEKHQLIRDYIKDRGYEQLYRFLKRRIELK
ncbi:MAG TPA: hypothetical protein VF791_06450 [Pyrinomonadaceae bacterium]